MPQARRTRRGAPWIWAIVGAAVLVPLFGGIAWWVWFRPRPVPSELTAEALAAEYYADPSLADARFGDRTLTVSGKPYFAGNTRLGQYLDSDEGAIAVPCVALSAGLEGEAQIADVVAAGALPFSELPGVVATLPPTAPALPSAQQLGDTVKLKGICKGMCVGRGILLDECELVQ